MCSEYVKQIIYTHSAQYLPHKCQLLLKLSPAVVMSQGVRERCGGQGTVASPSWGQETGSWAVGSLASLLGPLAIVFFS